MCSAKCPPPLGSRRRAYTKRPHYAMGPGATQSRHRRRRRPFHWQACAARPPSLRRKPAPGGPTLTDSPGVYLAVCFWRRQLSIRAPCQRWTERESERERAREREREAPAEARTDTHRLGQSGANRHIEQTEKNGFAQKHNLAHYTQSLAENTHTLAQRVSQAARSWLSKKVASARLFSAPRSTQMHLATCSVSAQFLSAPKRQQSGEQKHMRASQSI